MECLTPTDELKKELTAHMKRYYQECIEYQKTVDPDYASKIALKAKDITFEDATIQNGVEMALVALEDACSELIEGL